MGSFAKFKEVEPIWKNYFENANNFVENRNYAKH